MNVKPVVHHVNNIMALKYINYFRSTLIVKHLLTTRRCDRATRVSSVVDHERLSGSNLFVGWLTTHMQCVALSRWAVVCGGEPMIKDKETIITSPLDTRYTVDRDAERRRRETREWLRRRERELGFLKDAPSMAPENNEKR
jgi:hypothetical protein